MTRPDCIPVIEYPGHVLCVDAGYVRDRMVACYLVEAGDEVAVIETGTNTSAERIRRVVERRGWPAGSLRYVIVTHVHLDHAGGAGALMRDFPEATLLVHARGAPHMVDPARLEASVRRVYGDAEFDATYGTLVPVPEGRVRVMRDGDTLRLGDRELLFIDTPGHARHHFCVWDAATGGWFSGDTFGISFRELDTANGHLVFPTTTPIEFDPPALRTSVEKLLEWNPRWMYLTHFGRVGDVRKLAAQLLHGVDTIVAIAERHEHDANRATHIARDFGEWLVGEARAHGVEMGEGELLEFLGHDIRLNTQGVDFWLSRRSRK